MPKMIPQYNNRYPCSCATEYKFSIKVQPCTRINDSIIFNNYNNSNINQISELSISERIKIARISAGFTNEELSNKLGIFTSTLSRYENNQFYISRIDVNVLVNIALLCGREKYFCCDNYLIFKFNSQQIILNYMKTYSLNNSQMADKCNVSVTTIKSWKTKKYSPSYEQWEATFKNFDIPSEWLD